MSAEAHAKVDYSEGDYSNPYPRQSAEWKDYYLSYFEMLGEEMKKVYEEIKGESK